MPTIRTKLTLLLAALGLAIAQPAEGATPKKKATTSKTSSKSTKKRTKPQQTSSSKKRTSTTRARKATRSTARPQRTAVPTEAQLEQLRQDSIRLRTGGTAVSTATTQRIAQGPELLTTRFRQADSTLSRAEIRELYFTPNPKEDTESFIAQIERSADEQIERHRFDEALRLVQQGLWRMPTHLGLIKRACDLSSHLKNNRFNGYIYQLVELLSMISHSGDGSSPEKATEVRSLSDALLFEQLWRETPKEHLSAPKEIQHKGKSYYQFVLPAEQGKTVTRYYTLRTTVASASQPASTSR